jgi:hypothetical protein
MYYVHPFRPQAASDRRDRVRTRSLRSVNNITVQFPQERLEDISVEQLENTYRMNIFSFFHM